MVIGGGALRGVNINRLKSKFGKYLSQKTLNWMQEVVLKDYFSVAALPCVL